MQGLKKYMHFHSFHEFLQMGGYARFVWPAYGIVLLVLVLNIILPLKNTRRLIIQLKRRYHHEAR